MSLAAVSAFFGSANIPTAAVTLVSAAAGLAFLRRKRGR